MKDGALTILFAAIALVALIALADHRSHAQTVSGATPPSQIIKTEPYGTRQITLSNGQVVNVYGSKVTYIRADGKTITTDTYDYVTPSNTHVEQDDNQMCITYTDAALNKPIVQCIPKQH
jgi:hypothetical protein